MEAKESTPAVFKCSINGCNGARVTSGPISGQRMDEKCLVCTECGDETLIKATEVNN